MTLQAFPPKGAKKRNTFINLTIVLVTTLIMVVIMELVLQVVIRIRDGKWLYQQFEGSRVPYVKLVKDRRKFTLRPGFTDPNGGLKINEGGVRKGPYYPDKKGAIVVNAGDSVPFGVAVANEHTYPYYLAKLFKDKRLPVNVINAGVPSYNLRQSFDRLRWEIFPRFGLPRIKVITMQAANDVFLLSYYREKWNPDITWADRRFIKKSSLGQKIAIVHYLKMTIKKLSKEGGKNGPSAVPDQNPGQNPSEPVEKRKKYDKYDGTEMIRNARKVFLEELGFYRDHKIYVVLMPVDPFYYQLSNLEKNQTLKRWHTIKDIVDAIDELVTQYNHMLIGVSQQFDNVFFFDTRVLMDARDRQEMFADHIHYSPQGNKIIAQALYDFFLQHKLLPAEVLK